MYSFFSLFEDQVSRSRGGEIGLVWCLGRSCCSESDFWQEELFCIANHSAASQLFGDRISAPCPQHAVDPRRAQKRTPWGHTGCVFNRNPMGKFWSVISLVYKWRHHFSTSTAWYCYPKQLALNVAFVLTYPCIFYPWVYIQNVQGYVIMILLNAM